MLKPIPPEVLEKNLLLDRALKHLGLKRVWRRKSMHDCTCEFMMLNKDNREYRRFADALDAFGDWTINSLDDLLGTMWFGQCHFPLAISSQNFSIVKNPFYKMSQEELAVKLDLLEASA